MAADNIRPRILIADAVGMGARHTFMPGSIGTRDEDKYWKQAADLGDPGEELPFSLRNSTFLSGEYVSVILPQNVTDFAAYRRASRQGRGTKLGRAERAKVWKIVEQFRSSCVANETLTWSARAAIAAAILRNRDRAPFDHVLVDEAQDVHGGHWLFLRACVAPGPNDLFIAEDSHQRIYGQRLTLSHFGITIKGRASGKLTKNYRTTRENLEYAMGILQGQDWIGSNGEIEDDMKSYSSTSGPVPEVVHCTTVAEEAAVAAERIKAWQDAASEAGCEEPVIGVLVRTNNLVDRAVSDLEDNGVLATTSATDDGPGVHVMTMHRAKGMEFNDVVLLSVDKSVMPARDITLGLAKEERDDVLMRERALLYVAASRARESLVVITGEHPSELLP